MTTLEDHEEKNQYGIVANLIEHDDVLRDGAKAWISGGAGGEGLERFTWIAISKNSRLIEKWAPTARFSNFRAKWIPLHLRDKIIVIMDTRGTKEQMEVLAIKLEEFAIQERKKHPNRSIFPRRDT